MRISYAARLAVSGALLVAASLGLFGYLEFRQEVAMAVGATREELMVTVRNGAVVFSVEDLAGTTDGSKRRLQEQLDLLLRRNIRDKEFHLFIMKEGRPEDVLSSTGATPFIIANAPGAGDAALTALDQAIGGRHATVTPLYKEGGKLWVTGFAPIFDGGRVVGVLAGDREAVEYGAAVHLALRKIVYYGAAALAVAVVLGILAAFGVTRPLRRLAAAAVEAGEGRFMPVEALSNDEVATVAKSFNEAHEALARKIAELAQLNRELEDRVAERTKELSGSYDELRKRSDLLMREMNAARRVQETIIPRSLHRERIDIDVAYVPILEIGGDLGLVIERDPWHYDIAIGDVTGHGIGAALVGNRVHTLLAGLYAANAPLDALIHRLDYFLSEEISDIGVFLTLMAMRFDFEKMTIETAGGGHVAAMHYKASSRSLEDVESRCGIIGAGNLFCDTTPVSVTPIETGDRLLLYTDGIVDCTNAAGEAFGTARLSQAFALAAAPGAGGEIAGGLVRAAKDFTGGRFQDDVLVLVVQVK